MGLLWSFGFREVKMAVGVHYADERFLSKAEIEKIKNMVPEINMLHESVTEVLWCDFSTTWYCAGGLDVQDTYIESFRDYLLTDKNC